MLEEQSEAQLTARKRPTVRETTGPRCAAIGTVFKVLKAVLLFPGRLALHLGTV